MNQTLQTLAIDFRVLSCPPKQQSQSPHFQIVPMPLLVSVATNSPSLKQYLFLKKTLLKKLKRTAEVAAENLMKIQLLQNRSAV